MAGHRVFGEEGWVVRFLESVEGVEAVSCKLREAWRVRGQLGSESPWHCSHPPSLEPRPSEHPEAGKAPSLAIPAPRSGGSHCLGRRHQDQAGGIPQNPGGGDIIL